VGTSGGVGRLDIRRQTFTQFRHAPNDPGSLSHDYIRALLVDRRGRLWVGTDAGGLDRRDPGAATFAHHVHTPERGTISGNSVNAILQDADGGLWVGVWGGGLNRVIESPDGGGVTFVAYRHIPTDARSLASDDVNVLAQDRSGVLWIGTYGRGVSRFSPRAARTFTVYKHVPSDPLSLGDDRIYAVLVDRRGTLWVGTWGGLNSRASGAAGFTRHPVGPPPAGLSDRRIAAMAEGADGAVWIGTLDGGVSRIDPRTGRVRTYRHQPGVAGSLASDRTTSLYVDRSGVVWVGLLLEGLNRFDEATGSFTAFRHDPRDPSSLGHTRIGAMLEDSRGTFWIGTGAGLNILDRATGRVRRFASTSSAAPQLARAVSAIAEGADGTLWVGTMDAGIVRLRRGADGAIADVRGYRERDGLPSERIYHINLDAQGLVWASTNAGLVRIDPRDDSLRQFDRTDGLQADEFRSAGVFDRRTGLMYFGGVSGLTVFRPEAAAAADEGAPDVELTGFTIANQPVPVGDASRLRTRIAEAHEITLQPGDDVFSIEFAALDYATPHKARYAYTLEGFSREWHDTDASRRSATYTNLSPGRYVFKVRAARSSGPWSEPRDLVIVLRPPFWMTWWFRLLASAASVMVVLAGYRWRFHAIERHQRELEAIVATRTLQLREEKEKATAARRVAEQASAAKSTFLANISHEIRTPLNAVLGMADLLNHTPLTTEQQEYAAALKAASEALSELIGDTLDLSKIEVGRFELVTAPFDLVRLVEDTVSMMRVRARQKGLRLTCAIDPDVPHRVAGDSHALRRVLINLLGNAVKFTDAGSVAVVIGRDPTAPGSIRFSIADTGIGVPPEKQEMIFDTFVQADASVSRQYGGTGLGLAISRQLVELMGGRIALDSTPGRGSTFTFSAVLPPAPSDDAAVEDGERPAAALMPLRILLADDSPQNRLLVTAYLKATGDELETAENGRAALDMFAARRYDLVLMDIHMPVLDGHEATRAIRELEMTHGWPRTPIVALTAHAFAEDVENSRQAGCDAHLVKPISRGALLTALDRFRAAANGVQHG
jgi:signal transduction histidine kinase/ligand-binding sensor domain-containing protein